MKRGSWILAISGVLALNNGVGFTADPVPAEGQRALQLRNNRQGIPTRYSRPAAPEAPAPKNYYNELFSGQQAAPAANAPDWTQIPEQSKPVAKAADVKTLAAKPVGNKTASGRAVIERPASDKGAAPTAPVIRTAAAASEAPASTESRRFTTTPRGIRSESVDQKVIQAGYDKSPNSTEKKMIQQVRSESAAKKSTAPPMPDNEPEIPAGKLVAAGPAKDSGPQTPQVTIEWVKKGDINVGQECQVELHVKNCGSTVASQVAVDGLFPSTVRLTSADPKPAVSGDKVTWSFETMAPGAEHKITVKLIPSRRGDLGATANVRLTGTASAVFRVEEPMLKVALKGPSEILLGDPASQMIIVSNPGTGTVHDVKVEARISEGLEHGSHGDRLIMDVGSIGPGESRTVRLGLAAIKGGQQSVSVAATSSCEAGATAAADVKVIAPSMKIAVDGPALRYKGRNAKYTLTVTNDGSVANNNIRIAQTVSDGFKFVNADKNGKYDASTKNVQWFVGRLEPGQTATVTCELCAVSLGDFSQTASVLSDSGIRAEAKTQTRVEGVASLTMELVDIDDPVEIGAETAYEVRVKNEGTKAATGVAIACELPPEMELKSCKAPVEAIVEGRQILFKSLDQLAPGATVVYRVHVKGVREGNHRMRVRMTSASLEEPVVREEATKVYSDTK